MRGSVRRRQVQVAYDRFHTNTSYKSVVRTYGVVYEIAEEHVELVRDQLDFREKGGYVMESLIVYEYDEGVKDGNDETEIILQSDAKVYIATAENGNFLGPASHREIAHQIATCHGPSGPNIEYLLNLLESMEKLFPTVVDHHLLLLKEFLRKK